MERVTLKNCAAQIIVVWFKIQCIVIFLKSQTRELFGLVSASGATNQIRQMVFKNPDLIGKTITITVPASDQIDQLLKGYIKRDTDESRRKVSNQQIAWADTLKERGMYPPLCLAFWGLRFS